MPEQEPRRITVEVDAETHRQVRIKTAEAGLTISDAMRRLIEMWLTGDVRLEPQERGWPESQEP